MKGLSMFQTEIIQDAYNKDQYQSGNNQIDICFHRLLPPQINKIENKQRYTANNGREKIGVSNIPFNHAFSSLASASDIEKNTAVITMATPKVNKKLRIYWARSNKGETTPTVNQATATFPNISEALSNWGKERFITAGNSNMKQKLCQGTVDNIRVQTYWQIGERIAREELKHQGKAVYNKKVIIKLAQDLGFGRVILCRILQFYKAYPIVSTVPRQLRRK